MNGSIGNHKLGSEEILPTPNMVITGLVIAKTLIKEFGELKVLQRAEKTQTELEFSFKALTTAIKEFQKMPPDKKVG